MKDYRVTVKVRNNRILKAIEAVGGSPGQKWCQKNGLNYQTINDYVGIKISPLNRSGELRDSAVRLCEILNCLPEDLWSNDQLYPLETNISETEMNQEEIAALMHNGETSYLIDDTSDELKKNIALVLSSLTEREERVLKMRFEDEMTLAEIGKQMNTTRENIRNIEANALRKLRHPSRTNLLGQYLEGAQGDWYVDNARSKK